MGSCGGGSGVDGLSDDVMGGLKDGEVAGVVGGVKASTDIAGEGCIDD